MPLLTQLRDETGTLVPLCWGFWHINRIFEAIEAEGVSACDVEFPYTFHAEHHFEDERDGEIFEIHPGYSYEQFRR
jgi:hypothetical protein